MFVIDLQMNDPISASSYNVALSLEKENYDCFSFSMTYITMISTDTNSYAFFNYFLHFMTSYNDDIRRILKFSMKEKVFLYVLVHEIACSIGVKTKLKSFLKYVLVQKSFVYAENFWIINIVIVVVQQYKIFEENSFYWKIRSTYFPIISS